MRHSTLDMRSLLLDIELTPNNRPPSSTTVIRMHIQAGDGLRRSQRHRQLQLCVPLVTQTWAWCSSRSTVAVARVLGMSSSKPTGTGTRSLERKTSCDLGLLPFGVSPC